MDSTENCFWGACCISNQMIPFPYSVSLIDVWLTATTRGQNEILCRWRSLAFHSSLVFPTLAQKQPPITFVQYSWGLVILIRMLEKCKVISICKNRIER